jgi:CRISPR system Cascade subunit CasD
MSVLLLRLTGPMQSWGTQGRFSVRDTGLEPSKSGVIGLLCAALGRARNEPVDDLTQLTMAVRVNREGRLARDYHTAQEVSDDNGGGARDTILSPRYYLADADFLMGLEGERSQLETLDAAVRDPVWPIYLGRKSFVPSRPIAMPRPTDAIQEGELMAVLKRFPWFSRRENERPTTPLRFVQEVPVGSGEPRQDVPLSFAERRFGVRHVQIGFFNDIPDIRPEDHL